MANRILPFRQYDENDVINLFANDVADAKPSTNGNGSAGVFVTIGAADGRGGGNFTTDPINYIDRTELGASPAHTKNQYPEVQLKVVVAPVGAKAGEVLGVTLKQTLEQDENGEKLLYNPVKRDELQAVLSGQACPIATRGIFTLTADAIDNGGGSTTFPTPGQAAVIGPVTAGKVSGIDFDTIQPDYASSSTMGTGHDYSLGGTSFVYYSPANVIGTWLGTGDRVSNGPVTDAYAGQYAVLKLNL